MAGAMILVIDNYDSFTWNLVHYVMELGAEVRVERNDALTVADAMASGARGILLSPGPCTPDQAGITLDLVGACAAAHHRAAKMLADRLMPQAHAEQGQPRGGLMHGKTSPIDHDGSGVFAGLPSPFTATRYHSLIVTDVPDVLAVNATAGDGSVMGLRHRDLPIHGVQFHPESIATEHGHDLIANFLRLCGMNVAPRGADTRAAA